MNILSKKHWGSLIYNLIYPGFVGSMVYELVESAKDVNSFVQYFTVITSIKVIITVFYCVDFMHLYVDMHDTVSEEKRDWIYLLCDVATSLLFFFSFVFVKLENYYDSILLLALIPICFLLYKRKNVADVIFNLVYLTLSFGSFFYFTEISELNIVEFLLKFSISSLLFYCLYVFVYYEFISKRFNKKNAE